MGIKCKFASSNAEIFQFNLKPKNLQHQNQPLARCVKIKIFSRISTKNCIFHLFLQIFALFIQISNLWPAAAWSSASSTKSSQLTSQAGSQLCSHTHICGHIQLVCVAVVVGVAALSAAVVSAITAITFTACNVRRYSSVNAYEGNQNTDERNE